MTSSVFHQTSIPLLEQVLSFTEARHGILSGNIANLDTPGYQTQDLSVDRFQELLRKALAGQTSQGHVESQGYQMPGVDMRHPELRQVREALPSILMHDGSDVGLEQQVTELSKNQMMHNLAISIMTSQFRLLQTAVSERV